MALRRVVMNLDEDLLKMVDDYASSLHVSRTAAVSVLLSNACQQAQFMSKFPQLYQSIVAAQDDSIMKKGGEG